MYATDVPLRRTIRNILATDAEKYKSSLGRSINEALYDPRLNRTVDLKKERQEKSAAKIKAKKEKAKKKKIEEELKKKEQRKEKARLFKEELEDIQV